MKKRILSMIVAIVMVVGLIPAMAATAFAAEPAGEMTIYFQNNWSWTDVRLYYWGSADSNPGWPGNAMEYAGNDGNFDIYKATVPTDATGIIINGVKGDGSATLDQTPDITSGWYDGICYYMKWEDGNAVGSESIDTILPSGTPTSPSVPKITGVTVLLNGVEVTEPGDITVTDSDTLTAIFKGEHFDLFDTSTIDYYVQVGSMGSIPIAGTLDISSTPHTLTFVYTGAQLSSSNGDSIAYQNAGDANWTQTGYTVTYRAALAPSPVASVTVDGSVIGEFTDLQAAFNAAANASGDVTLTLLDSVTLDTTITVEGGEFTVDLNGKIWERDNFVLFVCGNANVLITDSAPEGGGTIRGTGSADTITLYDTANLEIAGGTVENTGGRVVRSA